jgi:hypothetical protein
MPIRNLFQGAKQIATPMVTLRIAGQTTSSPNEQPMFHKVAANQHRRKPPHGHYKPSSKKAASNFVAR